ncbi:MAG TPA: SIR2 family protein, partial [Candidatus Limnocylindrales bacterium]|nr:SIR2 family protein [Candidatus Limnocylindrales bacterium]
MAHSFMLLGAGASVDAGVPPANYRFVDRIAEHLRGLREPSGEAAVAELEAIRVFVRGRTGQDPGLEPVYECVDESLDARFQRIEGAYPASRAVERIEYETRRVIQTVCSITDPARVEWLLPLFRRLRRFSPYPIVSLNYDNVVERICARAGLRLAESVVGEDTARCDIELVKLHGSVTWMPGPGSRMERIGRGADVVRRLGAVRSPILETPMVYPSRRKMPLYEPFMRNAARFQQLLADRRYRQVIVVGYRFPDSHVRRWLETALRARPDLRVCLIGPDPELPDEALDNLTRNLPSIPWTERLTIVKAKFRQAIGDSPRCFERAVANGQPFGPRVAYGTAPATNRTPLICYTGRANGIAASVDGASLFITEPGGTSLRHVHLDTGRISTVCSGLHDPRGIAAARDGTVLVVQNAALPRFPRGFGNVVAVGRNGSRRALNGPAIGDVFTILRALRAGKRGDALWSELASILRWPTEVVVLPDGSVFVTEARALTELRRGRRPDRICEPELVFNLHGLDAAATDALVAVEEGVARDSAWGRVESFVLGTKVTVKRSTALEGLPRMMGVCFVPPRQIVVVTQCLTWPHGRLIAVDYPSLENARFVAGFDLPQKIAYVPARDQLAV